MSSFEFIRMPIFTILSGFLYGHHRVAGSTLAVFTLKKIRRILVPLLVASTIYWVLKTESSNDTRSLPDALFWSYEHLWYLQALIILFAAAAIADAVFRPSPAALLVAVVVLALISAGRPDVGTLFSIDGTIYLAPYFAFGVFLATAPRVLEDRRIGILLGILAGVILIVQQAGLNDLIRPISKYEFVATVCGIASCVFLLHFMRPVSLLSTVGRYSLHDLSLACSLQRKRPKGHDRSRFLCDPAAVHSRGSRRHWRSYCASPFSFAHGVAVDSAVGDRQAPETSSETGKSARRQISDCSVAGGTAHPWVPPQSSYFEVSQRVRPSLPYAALATSLFIPTQISSVLLS
jgi:hypothetical protein